MIAPIKAYGELFLERSCYPQGTIADIWYEASLQLRIIHKLMNAGTEKLYSDSNELIKEMDSGLNGEQFNNAHEAIMQISIYVRPYFYNVLILQVYGILELALAGFCKETYKSQYNKKNKARKGLSLFEIIVEILKENQFILDKDLIDKIDLWRLVRNRLIHDVGICKSKDEASEFHEKLGLEIEETQLRIMAEKTICDEMIMTCDKFLHNVFRQNVFKDKNW